MADGTIIHGGLTDRYKGKLTAYYLSKKHKSSFSIFNISPVNYSAFWHSDNINLNKLTINPFRFKIWFIPSLQELETFEKINTEKFRNKSNLLYVSENILSYLYEDGKWEIPTQQLYKELDELGTSKIKISFNKKHNEFNTSTFEILHFRCLNYFNDFDDSNLKPIEEDQIPLAIDTLINQLEANYKNLKAKIILSDSRKLLSYFDEKGYRVFSLETTKHMDNLGHKEIEYLRAYQENHLLTLADRIDSYVFYHNREKPFNSHFAYYAAIYGGVPFHKFGYNLNTLEISDLKGNK